MEFDDSSDKKHVLRNGPCHFDKSLVLMKEFDGIQQVRHVRLIETILWIQVFDLLMMARNEFKGRIIGN